MVRSTISVHSPRAFALAGVLVLLCAVQAGMARELQRRIVPDLKRAILSRGRGYDVTSARTHGSAGLAPDLLAQDISRSASIINDALVMCSPSYTSPRQGVYNPAFVRRALETMRPELLRLREAALHSQNRATAEAARQALEGASTRIKQECNCDADCRHDLTLTHHPTTDFDVLVEVLTPSGRLVPVRVHERLPGTHAYPS